MSVGGRITKSKAESCQALSGDVSYAFDSSRDSRVVLGGRTRPFFVKPHGRRR
jgi:hypothetical protein